MYEVFIGNYERLIGTVAFYRKPTNKKSRIN